MKKGFMRWVRDYIQSFPGLTAEEYSLDALEYEYARSDAGDSVGSLATTLHKQVREGKEPLIRRDKIGDKYRFFPVKGVPITTPSENIAVQISLSKQELREVDNLVTKGKFHNRSEAIEWLVKGCIALKSCDSGFYLGYPYWH